MSTSEKNTSLIKIGIILLCCYAALSAAFCFLAGEQLLFRQSKGAVSLAPAEGGTIELVQGCTVEQLFSCEIQRFQGVHVQWATYYRENAGTAQMELIDTRTDEVLLSQSYDVATITEGELLELIFPKPREDLMNVPLLLRITADSLPGTAATPFMTNQDREGWQLLFNGTAVPGSLCITVEGQDYIWIGIHYRELVVIGALLLLLFWGVVCWRSRKGKRAFVLELLSDVKKYQFLIRQLVSRDFKTKYKRSVLGMFWSFLNPLLTMLVQYFVFSNIFRSDIPNFFGYLLIGIVTFNFFSEACGLSLPSILENAGLITKVYMPKYIYPLTRVLSSLVNLAISLIPLVLVCAVTGVRFHKAALLAPFFMVVCVTFFSLGLGMLLSTSMVFFRDTKFLWGVFNMMWMYATPIFYPESILPDSFKVILRLNPLYHFIKSARMCILDGMSPEPMTYVRCFLIALVMLLVGAWVFRRNQDKFVLYL